jgi:hypothetical protein
VFGCFSVCGQKQSVEDVVYLPMRGQFDVVNTRADDLCDVERSKAFGAQLGRGV